MGHCASRLRAAITAGPTSATGALKRKRDDADDHPAAEAPAQNRPPSTEMSRAGTVLRVFWCIEQVHARSMPYGCVMFLVDTLRANSDVRLSTRSPDGGWTLLSMLLYKLNGLGDWPLFLGDC